MSTITLTLLGGGNEIGANSYLIETDQDCIVLDCGTHPKKDGLDALPRFDLLRRSPQAVLISHGHVDHCGAAPLLLKNHPAAMAYATRPTVSIMDRMLHNSVSVMHTIARERHINEYPLYEHEDVDVAMARTLARDYNTTFEVAPTESVRACFLPAGHVLGSASVLIEFPGHTVLYTGDICEADQELLGGRVPLDPSIKVDTLIIESTYGANDEADSVTYRGEIRRFSRQLAEVLNRGGCVLVPSFALGRAQEMLNIIARLQEDGLVPDVPVYASGLGRAIYEVYSRFQDYLKPEATLRPLRQFRRIGDVWNPKIARELVGEPCIIVATSGMMMPNTPSAMIAQELVRHEHHGVFFVGYLDPDTLGYKLLHTKKGEALEFSLPGTPVDVALENIQWFHFSAHAPREALRAVVSQLAPKNVVYVHGDPEAVSWMESQCSNGSRAHAPNTGHTIVLEA